ncbi:hypothetical protein VNI00_014882 [Paramarasmius palmivorus]|uniref:CxC2-like cysteine cluster KDZ transposase-associated domain-containing protein n=1 Tax=Paramarasmius palmivorus TaxID=297713 RepID=A0AAW0BPI4_9AGAR
MGSRKRSRKRSQRSSPIRTFTAQDFDDSDDSDHDTKRSKPTAFISSLSTDRRRVVVEPVNLSIDSPAKKVNAPVASSSSKPISSDGFDAFASFSADLLAEELQGASKRKGKQRERPKVKKDTVMRDWMSYRNEYLEAFMSREGRGDNSLELCLSCNHAGHAPLYRCRDCCSMQLVCRECIVEQHRRKPLDIIEKWNGKFFERVSLHTLGLSVQLGHIDGSLCQSPRPAPTNFTVIHTNGFHRVAVNYCSCYMTLDQSHPRQQLIRYEWYPATHSAPQTCFTFRLLENFHAMTLLGKISAYDYYRALEKLTDDCGRLQFKNRYRSFRRAARQYRHLKMLKRGGKGNDANIDVSKTQAGELALLCPACPQVGINLPENWENTSTDKKFLYTMFLAVDACFRLKRKLVSSEEADPGLGTGWAYMVEDEPYRSYLKDRTSETEMSSCSGLAALDHANSRNARGNYATSGVALGCCARHEMIQPNGVGDLQKGERYCNVDWVVASLLRYHDHKLKICLSYDICCQYCRKFIDRIGALPLHVRPAAIHRFLFVIPKLHIYGHKLSCQLAYSLNLTPGVGRTDGEGIERNWAGQGPIATSTTEMGPGSRHDTLDDHWANWNWRKILGLGSLLTRRWKLTKTWLTKQQCAFDILNRNQASQVPVWKKMVEDFEADGSKPNPYAPPTSTITIQMVREELAREYESNLKTLGGPDQDLASNGPGEFILLALEMEERQRQLKEDARVKLLRPTSKQAADLLDKRVKLRRLLTAFERKQNRFMPIVSSLRVSAAEIPVQPENVPLYLPSQLSEAQVKSCPGPDLSVIEARFRNAQCSESLDEMRNQLLIKWRLRTYKGLHVRHQEKLRRSNTLLNLNESKIHLHSQRYQDAWSALRVLSLRTCTTLNWRELKRSDIRCMEDPEDGPVGNPRKNRTTQTTEERAEVVTGSENQSGDRDLSSDNDFEPGTDEDETPTEALKRWQQKRDKIVKQTGEGKRVVSWIWVAADGAGYASDDVLHNSLRIEWAKTYARLNRWKEESFLLIEEMRRVLEAFKWTASVWQGRAVTGNEAKDAYALRQADKVVVQGVELGDEEADDYEEEPPVSSMPQDEDEVDEDEGGDPEEALNTGDEISDVDDDGNGDFDEE